MAGDPNARRDKALEAIARELGEISKFLKQIERNTRRVTFTNHPERPDAFDVPQRPQPGEAGKDDEVVVLHEPEEPKFPSPTHPYLKRSQPDDSGPYGIFPPRPDE